MPLKYLNVGSTSVSDISALRGMPLETVILNETAVSDVSALRDMPLEIVEVANTQVTDVSPLASCKKLKRILVVNCKIAPMSLETVKKAVPSCTISN